ncbi:MAG: hypothetical protein ACYT04_73955, partial [Nostoc sp.]
MINHRGVCNGCLLSLVASVCIGLGSNLVKQELTLAESPVNKEEMPAAGYAYASVVRKTSVQSALVTKWKAKREQTPVSEVRQLNSIERPLRGRSYVLGVSRDQNLIAQLTQATTPV